MTRIYDVDCEDHYDPDVLMADFAHSFARSAGFGAPDETEGDAMGGISMSFGDKSVRMDRDGGIDVRDFGSGERFVTKLS